MQVLKFQIFLNMKNFACTLFSSDDLRTRFWTIPRYLVLCFEGILAPHWMVWSSWKFVWVAVWKMCAAVNPKLSANITWSTRLGCYMVYISIRQNIKIFRVCNCFLAKWKAHVFGIQLGATDNENLIALINLNLCYVIFTCVFQMLQKRRVELFKNDMPVLKRDFKFLYSERQRIYNTRIGIPMLGTGLFLVNSIIIIYNWT